ncbi:MAG: hypothetical protein FWC46_06280 [Actinomycetia bacterium]|nr:hypothetical protein [Actinomycetes bacterium]
MTDSLRESLKQLVEQLTVVAHAQSEGSYPVVAAVFLPEDVAALLRVASAALRSGQITTTTPSRQHSTPKTAHQSAHSTTPDAHALNDRPVSVKGVLVSHLDTLFPTPESQQRRADLIRFVQGARADATENAISVALGDLVRDGHLVRAGIGLYERGPHVPA